MHLSTAQLSRKAHPGGKWLFSWTLYDPGLSRLSSISFNSSHSYIFKFLSICRLPDPRIMVR